MTDDVSLVDLMPTLLDLANATPPAVRDGRDLMPLLRGQPVAAVPAVVQFLRRAPQHTALIGWDGFAQGDRWEACDREGHLCCAWAFSAGAWSSAAPDAELVAEGRASLKNTALSVEGRAATEAERNAIRTAGYWQALPEP